LTPHVHVLNIGEVLPQVMFILHRGEQLFIANPVLGDILEGGRYAHVAHYVAPELGVLGRRGQHAEGGVGRGRGEAL